MGFKNYYAYYCKLEEADFLHLTDSLYQASIKLLERQNIRDDKFVKLERQSIENERVRKLDMYPETYKCFTKKLPVLSDAFPNPYQNFPLNDP